MRRSDVTTPTFGPIAYGESGTGPDALFIHGVFLNADLWGYQVEALSDLRHCIALDLLAHGDSPCPPGHLTIGVQAAMVVEFLDALGVEQVDLVGNDTGGAVAQMFAATHPDRVRSLALTNSDVHDNFPPEAFLPIKDLATQGLLAEGIASLARDPVAIRAALATSLEHPESIPDDTLVGFFAAFTSPDKAGALQDYVAGMEPSELVALKDDLARFEAPTLIVWATDDVFFPVEWAGWLEATVPGVTRSVRVEGARLFFPLERPEVLIQELRQFWNGAVAHE
jgi:pimeloyl-ACP methyl ester carboxylesterase